MLDYIPETRSTLARERQTQRIREAELDGLARLAKAENRPKRRRLRLSWLRSRMRPATDLW